jgi:hypothetical protein
MVKYFIVSTYGLAHYKCFWKDSECSNGICFNSFWACSKQHAISQQIEEFKSIGKEIPEDLQAMFFEV